MIELFSNEFWIATLFIFYFFLVVFLYVLVKKINQLKLNPKNQPSWDEGLDHKASEQASKSTCAVIDMLEPLLREARKTAIRFDEQIKEKKRLLKELNDALDNRIININLLLSRAQTQHKKLIEQQNNVPPVSLPGNSVNLNFSPDKALDQQYQIINMYNQNLDTDTIAHKLAVPKGEVQMVVDLKKKFLEMEKNNP